MTIPFQKLIGLSGVSAWENARARFWGRVFQVPMLLLAIWIPFQFYFDYTIGLEQSDILFFDWLVWWFFVIESTLLIYLVDDKRYFLKTNWMNILIIIAGLPIILWGYSPLAAVLRSLRLVLMAGLIYRLTRTLREVLNRNQLGTTLLVAVLIVVISGAIIAAIDPGFDSPAEGVWWALVTITTVGYGDYTPISGPGRVFGALLIVTGVVLLSLITANLAAYFVEKEVEKDVEEETREEERFIDEQFSRIEKRLDMIEQSLEKLGEKIEERRHLDK